MNVRSQTRSPPPGVDDGLDRGDSGHPMGRDSEWEPRHELIEACEREGNRSALFIVGPLLDTAPHLLEDERVRRVVTTAVERALGAGWSLNDVRYVLGESTTDRLIT